MSDFARPRHILPVIVLSQFAGSSLWFAGNALLPDLQSELGLGDDTLAGVTSSVQLGFIVGTLAFALSNLSDRFRPRDVFLGCAVLGALANAALLILPALDRPYPVLLSLRFVTGFFLAGIYPVGMKIAASWYREGLGAALGWLVGALVLGTAFPHLVRALGTGLAWTHVAVALSVLAIAGGLLMHATVHEGPHLARAAAFDPLAVVRAFRSPEFRASASGYFGHMWELYTLWAFMPVLLAGYAARHAIDLDVPTWSFLALGAGAIGCVGGGLLSRRLGSARVAFAQLGLSGSCCLLSPLAFLMPLPAFLAFMVFWGIVVAGDSPQFSALNAATAPRAYVGSALTIVNCIGFAITIPSLYVMTAIASVLPIETWFVAVAIGPALGLAAFRKLVRRS
jgi:hypothetical protein